MFNLTVVGSDIETVSLKKIPSLRATFAVAATLIWGGVVLAFFVDVRWLVLPALAGFGLTLTAVTGVCPMAFFVEHAIVRRRAKHTAAE